MTKLSSLQSLKKLGDNIEQKFSPTDLPPVKPKTLDAHSSGYIGVHPSIMHPGHGTIYILIDERAAFDLIDLPMVDHGPKPHGHVLSKVIDGDQYIIFQHWIKQVKP